MALPYISAITASIGTPKSRVHPGYEPEDGTNLMPLGPERTLVVFDHYFEETEGDKGPQATFVRPVGKHHIVS